MSSTAQRIDQPATPAPTQAATTPVADKAVAAPVATPNPAAPPRASDRSAPTPTAAPTPPAADPVPSAASAPETLRDDGLLALLRAIPAGRLTPQSTRPSAARQATRDDVARPYATRGAGTTSDAAKPYDIASVLPPLIASESRAAPPSAAAPAHAAAASPSEDAKATQSAHMEDRGVEATPPTPSAAADSTPVVSGAAPREATHATTVAASPAAQKPVASDAIATSPTPSETVVATPVERTEAAAPAARSMPTTTGHVGARESSRASHMPSASRAAEEPAAEVSAPTTSATDDEIAAAPIGRVDLSASAPHPAPAMAALLAPQARDLLALAQGQAPSGSTGAARTRASDSATRSAVSSMKTMTIEISPESLGPMVVKMKLVHSGVDMKISVRSPEALHELESCRDALVETMRSVGCAIDGCTIQITAQAPDGSQAQNGGASFGTSSGNAEGERREQTIAREGAGDGQGAGGRRRETTRDDGAPEVGPRRAVDGRGGGMYL